MTAARQERKSSRPFQALFVVFALAFALCAAFAAITVRAATTELVVVNRTTGLAIDGFDPVAYFVDAAPKEGRPGLELRSGGAIWRFHNEGNRSAFAGAPGTYAPRFGGHDPMGLARGVAASGHPQLWLIAEQRLYLFHSAEARSAFARDPLGAIEAAERNWTEVQRTLVRN